MEKTSYNSSHAYWYLFLVSPFLTCILAFKNYNASWSKNILWAFVVFFGITFGIAKEVSTASTSTDVYRTIESIKNLYNKQLSFAEIKEKYVLNKDIDILQLTLFIGISRFTDNIKVILGVEAFIFGFFFSRNIWYVLDRLKGKIQFITVLLIACYFLVNPFWNINGFRFYTATHVFIYGLIPYLFEGKKKGLLISCLAFLVHFSFLVPITVLLLYTLIGNRTIIYFVFFIASIATSEINISSFNAFVEANAPKSLSERTSGYRGKRQVDEFRKGSDTYVQKSTWYVIYYTKALYWSINALLIYIFFQRKFLLGKYKMYLNSLCFTFLMWGIANIFSSLPSGERYLTIAVMAALPLVIFYLHLNYQLISLQKLARITVPALMLFIIIAVRTGFYTLSINTFIGNPIVAIFTDYNFALNDFLK